ncbi:MAG: hypothetical protein GY847_27730 [Proteobacteria bacterium]|nr:hypothetical protein [Pseudomonadota bacterium]
MGGPGSTRWNGYEKKTTVEDCTVLPVQAFAAFKQATGILHWRTVTGSERASIGYQVIGYQDSVILSYSRWRSDVEVIVPIDTTYPNFGGYRWWFLCPDCRRRVGKLYLPPSALRFSCLRCHHLTYETTQLKGTWLGGAFSILKSCGY